MTFADTEFDGIDEIFPDLKGGKLPEADGKEGLAVPGHGWLYCRKWTVGSRSGTELQMQVDCAPAPVVFRRALRLEGETLTLDYEVVNNGKAPLFYLYAFHPLFAGVTGCRIELPDEAILQAMVSWSFKGFLGALGQETSWSQLRDGPLRGGVYREGSGRYYKYFVKGLKRGEVTVRYPGGDGVRLEWPLEKMPYLAVWCSEGGVDGLEHLAPEPTTTCGDSVRDALGSSESRRLEPGSPLRWTIRMRLVPGNGR